MAILPDSGPVAERLDREQVGWVTTVTAGGQPQSTPVWFVVHDDAVHIQSQPDAAKVRNIRATGKVSFHLNSDSQGGEVVTVDGDAEILDTASPEVREVYLAKYERALRDQLQMTSDELLADYGTTVRVIPRRVRTY